MAYYLDTSALTKLVVAEAQSAALMTWVGAQSTPLISSDLARTELLRAVRRVAPERTVIARQVLDGLVLTVVTTAIFERAGLLDPPTLRTLDALHCAAALDLGDELEGLVTYDDRLAGAAQALGIVVLTPE